MLRFDDVSFVYPGPPPLTALQPTTLSISTGEYVAVIGPSGSGKSTLMNLAGLLDQPTQGRVLIDDIDTGALRESDRTALRGRRIGFVFQSFHLMPYRTVLDNVMLAGLYAGVRKRHRRAAGTLALERVGLADRMSALPSQLSGGQRQRVAIARALAHNPALLLCDEPTGNLDTATTGDILALLGAVNDQGVTIVVITHNPIVSADASRRIQIKDGHVSELE